MVCHSCKTKVSDDARYCPICGKAPGAPGPAAIVRTAIEESEKLLFAEGTIKVTTARLMVNGTTYAMSGVTSVGTRVKRPSKIGPLIMTGLGVVLLLKGFSPSVDAGTISWGVAIAFGGVVWLTGMRSTYTVHIATASGDKEAYESKNHAFVRKIITAMNEAIVLRG
jgi:Family of unknown function (DUF6232)